MRHDNEQGPDQLSYFQDLLHPPTVVKKSKYNCLAVFQVSKSLFLWRGETELDVFNPAFVQEFPQK